MIASAGVVSDSTATVIGAMIVAPLMTPILGIVLAVVLSDGANLRRCLLLVIAGAAAVVGIGWLAGLFVPYAVVSATNVKMAGRVTLQVADLVAALSTGALGSVDWPGAISPTCWDGVAIAISLVPPLAGDGLTLEPAPPASHWMRVCSKSRTRGILTSGIVLMTCTGSAGSGLRGLLRRCVIAAPL